MIEFDFKVNRKSNIIKIYRGIIIKRLLILLIILNIYINAFTENKIISYYIPIQEEIDAFFNLSNTLIKYEENLFMKIDKETMIEIAKISAKHEILQSFYFEAYLRVAQNKNVINFINNDLKNIYEENEIYKTIQREQNAKKTEQDKGIFSSKYSCGNDIYTEKINLFKFNEILLFNNTLHSFIFENDWQNITFTPKDENVDDVLFMTGGGTNSFTISFKRIKNISMEDFINNYINKDSKNNKSKDNFFGFENLKIEELPNEGFIKYCQADKVFISYGTNINDFSHQDGKIVLYLYADRYKSGYIIDYFMNFSEINNLIKISDRIYKQLIQFILFSWIE